MKKTAKEILDENVSFRDKVKEEFVLRAMKAYALEAIKADRERVAEEVYMKHNGSHQCKQLILNLPIELK